MNTPKAFVTQAFVAVVAGLMLGVTLGFTVPSSAPEWASRPRQRPTPTAPDPEQVKCLAQALYWEARGEGSVGMQAVADVILARVARRWRGAETVCAVVWAPAQFEGMERVGEPVRSPEMMRRAIAVARAALGESWPTLVRADHFHAVTIAPAWAHSPKMRRVATWGGHEFYRHN